MGESCSDPDIPLREARRKAGQNGTEDLPECTLAHKLYGIKCKGGELLDALANDENWCTIQYGHGEHCDTIIRIQQDITARENEQAKVVMQLVLTLCGFIPVVGEPCDALDAFIAYLQGDKTGAALSALAMIPGAGWLFGGGRGVDLLRQLNKFTRRLCGNSFAPGTPVLLADGRARPIEKVRGGDLVLATDPETNRTGARRVTATITGTGLKQLVDLTVDTDGDRGPATATITATDNHPFWEVGTGRWVKAGDLAAGQRLRASAGTVAVVASRHRTQPATVHNLTVAGLHTYYVLGGNRALLVHNDGAGLCDDAAKAALAGNDRLNHAWRHLQEAGIVTGNWSGRTSPEALRAILGPILKNPTKRVVPTHTQGDPVEIFVGQYNGRWVAVQVWTGGTRKGQMATAYEPTLDQLRNWGVTP